MRDRNAPLSGQDIDKLAWDKMDGLLPVTVQDASTGRMLMLGYVTREALGRTLAEGLITFWSRSKARLWTKGESSGNQLRLVAAYGDCDGDAVLMLADPTGPTCHLGTASCFGAVAGTGPGWLAELSRIVAQRAASGDDSSYTRRLLADGPMRIAQKIGEEGVELALAGAASAAEECAAEAADLLYHLCVLMESRRFGWGDVVALLQARHLGQGATG